MTIGFVALVAHRRASARRGHQRDLVVRRWADHAGAMLPGPGVPDLRPHREAGATGPGPDRDPGRVRRPLGGRAAPDRARPARRRAGAAGRPRHEPRHGRRHVRPTTRKRPGGWSPRRAATTGAALGDLRTVVRGIHPPVLADRGLVRRGPGAGARHGRAGQRATPICAGARRRRSSRPSTSRSPSAWPTSASTPGLTMPGSELSHDGRRPDARSWVTTVAAAPTRPAAPVCAG